MKKIGLIYGSETGVTEEITTLIVDNWTVSDIHVMEVSQVKKICGDDLSKVKSCVKLTGFVNSTEDFTEQPKVINGASDLIALIFGDAGMHTRAAVSTNSLPLGVSVEVDAIFEIN